MRGVSIQLLLACVWTGNDWYRILLSEKLMAFSTLKFALSQAMPILKAEHFACELICWLLEKALQGFMAEQLAN